MAAAAASLLGLGAATVGPPPSAPPATPGAAAAFELLRPLAKTAPAAPGSGESRDDRLLENFLANRPSPTPPAAVAPVPRVPPVPAPAPAAPVQAPVPAPARPLPAPLAPRADTPAAPSRADKDASLVGDLIAASPTASAGKLQDQSGRDAGVLDNFLRKHAPGPEAFVRRKPPPLSSLETPKAQDDAKLLQLMGGRADGVRFSPSAAPGSFGGAGYGGYAGYAGYAEADARPGPMGYGLPVARRGPERPRLGAGRGAARRGTGGRGKARTNIVEERAKDDVHEENLQLRRAQMEMKTKLQKLQVQIRQAQEPKDAKAFEQKANELGEMHRAMSAPRGAKATSPSGQRRGVRA
ncbi:unnamed protein product, partial [Cladocopium goreaui]